MHRQKGEDILALLIPDAVGDAQDAAVGLRARRLLLDHFELGVQRVAGTHRAQPAQFIEPGRPHARSTEYAGFQDHAEPDRERLKAAGDESSIVALARRLDVDVKGLRVIGERKADDHALGERDAARRKSFADGEIVEIAIGHCVQPMAATIAAPSSFVVALPPRSGVRGPFASASTRAIAFSISAAAAPSSKCSSIIAPDQIWPTGLAMPLP